MSTARARKIKETNQVARLVKDLDKRMESFEESVAELKILKESITELSDQVTEQEARNTAILRQLNENLKENKTKALTEAAESVGKVLITSEQLEEYKQEVQKWKNECSVIKASTQKEIKEKVDEQLERQLKILELQYENKSAKLSASCENSKTEVLNLKDTINRMAQELDSQKKLTADVARVRTETKQN